MARTRLVFFLENTAIEYVDNFTSLGVVFTATMSWNAHVSKICVALSRFNGIIWRNKGLLPAKTKLNLYYAFFYSHVSYCFLVWGNTTVTNIQKLVSLQKKLLRAVANVSYDSPTFPLYQQYKIVKIDRMFDYKFPVFYKEAVSRNDPFFSSFVTLTHYHNPYPTRKTNKFVLPRCRTNYGYSMLAHILPTYLHTPLYEDVTRMSFPALRNTFVT
ncbi:uncharacterized protein LOC144149805 [Haemaphysalis longicornis]